MDALQAYNEAIRLKPNYADAWYNKGVVFYNRGRGRYDEAIKAFDEAIRLDPQYADAWYSKGSILGAQGRYDEAIKAIENAIKINSKSMLVNVWSKKLKILQKYQTQREHIEVLKEEYVRKWSDKEDQKEDQVMAHIRDD